MNSNGKKQQDPCIGLLAAHPGLNNFSLYQMTKVIFSWRNRLNGTKYVENQKKLRCVEVRKLRRQKISQIEFVSLDLDTKWNKIIN